MCRRHQMYGCSMITFGIGLWVGFWLGSWFWCGFGGMALCCLGFSILRRR